MKSFLNLKIYATTALSVSLLIITSCVKNNIDSPSGPIDKHSVFDFATQSVYNLNLKYDVPEGYNVYFEVYAEHPLNYDYEKGSITKRTDLNALDKGYTDAKGVYKNPITLPAYVKELYIYSPYAGVKQLLTCSIKDGSLTEPTEILPPAPPVATSAASQNVGTKAFMSTTLFDTPTKTLGTWDFSSSTPTIFPNDWYECPFGRPNYLAFVYGKSGSGPVSVPDAIWKSINTALPGDNNGPVDPKLLQTGDIHITKEAELSLYIIGQECLYNNALAYYCYPTNNPPQKVQDIKIQTLAFPNSSIGRRHTSSGSGVALLEGEGIKLKYCNNNGDLQDKFPAGTSIGWILYSNGFHAKTEFIQGQIISGGTVSKGLGPLYSNKDFNKKNLPYTAVFRHGDFVVTTFEDSEKSSEKDAKDYRDLMFHVGANPADAITPEIPNIDPEEPSNTEVTHYGILAFEDIWPYRGDFDMNDVVVKYASTIVYNTDNQVVETKNKYTILWSGAELDNSFAYQDPNLNENAVVTFQANGGSPSADLTNKIIRVANNVKSYAKNPDKVVVTVTTKYASPIAKANFTLPPYNPFITVNSKPEHEVHLTNQMPTVLADQTLLGVGHDKSKPEVGIYYVTFDGNGQQMPFGINVAFASEEDANKFVIPQELEPVNERYPDFLKWVKSKGTEGVDWYLHPKK